MNHQIKINVKYFHVFKKYKYNKPMNGSELRIQLWTLHVAEAGRTWPFLIRIPSQFKAFQVLINCFYGFGFWTFWISSFGFWIRTSCAWPRTTNATAKIKHCWRLPAGYECWCWTEAQLRQLRKKFQLRAESADQIQQILKLRGD